MPNGTDMSATLYDIASRTNEDGSIRDIAEIMRQDNAILDDMRFIECNSGTGHKTTIRTGLPKAFWRKYNMGVPTAKSMTTTIIDHTGMLEVRSKVDADLVSINTNPAAYRLSEDVAFLQGMNRQAAETLIYGDSTTPEAFVGLAARYNDKSALCGTNIIDAGGTGSDNTSIYIVGWGDRTVHGLYPRGTVGGLQKEDKGKMTVQDADGNDFDALVTKFSWKLGLCVRDWRYVVRIANIKTGAFDSDSAADLTKLLIKGMNKIPGLRAGVNLAVYCNTDVLTELELQAFKTTKGNAVNWREVQGSPVLHFRNVPIRKVDAILNTEEQVA